MTELLFYKFGFSWFGLVELATRFLKYEPIPASHFRPFLIPILIRYCFNFNNTLKKRRWCAGYLNPGPQDGRHRRNHGAMVTDLHVWSIPTRQSGGQLCNDTSPFEYFVLHQGRQIVTSQSAITSRGQSMHLSDWRSVQFMTKVRSYWVTFAIETNSSLHTYLPIKINWIKNSAHIIWHSDRQTFAEGISFGYPQYRIGI